MNSIRASLASSHAVESQSVARNSYLQNQHMLCWFLLDGRRLLAAPHHKSHSRFQINNVAEHSTSPYGSNIYAPASCLQIACLLCSSQQQATRKPPPPQQPPAPRQCTVILCVLAVFFGGCFKFQRRRAELPWPTRAAC